uniref:LEM domain-containing protein n=1 Tax=Meloidogyne incognita TaxID=6306 RepID=A0A914L0U4_MELIC
MSDQFSQLSNDELRQELIKNGIPFGPIGSTTRKVYEKKLQNFLENGVEPLIANNETGITNGGGHEAVDTIDFSNDNGHTPSREVSPVLVQHTNGVTASPQHREGSARPGAENDSDNEEDSCEKILSPDEARAFRLKFNPPSDNGSYTGAYRRRGVDDRRLTPAKTPPPQSKGKSFRRVALGMFIAFVMLTFVGILVYLAFGPEMKNALERFDFSVFYASLTGGKQIKEPVISSNKGN